MKKTYYSAFKKWKSSLLAVSAVSLFYVAGCDDLPTDVVMPVFSVGADIPLIDTATTIDEMIKDTTFLKKDRTNGNLFITQETAIPTTLVGDSLQLKETSVNFRTTLNDQDALLDNATQLGRARVKITDLFPALPPPPGESGVPAQSDIKKDIPIPMPENMEYINFRKTRLSLGIGNSYPFDISLGIPEGYTTPGVVLVFPEGEERFIELNSTQQTIPSFKGRGFEGDPGGPITTEFTNRMFNEGIRIRANISTPGTNGGTVQYDSNSVLVIRLFFTESEIIDGKFSYPSEQLLYNIASPLPDGAKITEATVKQLEMTLNVANQFNVAGNATITMPQFRRVSDGAALTKQFRIEKKATQTVTITNNFEAYRLQQDTADKNGYIDAARVVVDFILDSTATNNKQLFREADDLTVTGKVTTLRFHEVKGLSLPEVKFNVSSETSFNIKGNISNLTFNELVLKDMDINMVITNGAGIKGILSGTADIFGKSGNKLATITIADHEIQAADFSTPGVYIPKETSINLNEKSLNLKEVPYSIKFNGSVRTVENQQFAVDATNRIDGKVVITIPLAVRITGGTYTRELTLLDIDADVRKREKNVDYAELKIESRNRIPANIGLAMHFYDAQKNKVLSVPTDAPTIAIAAAPVGTNSVATGEAKSFQRVRLSQAQTKALLNAKYYTVEATFSTSGGTESYAKFMLNDYLKLKMGLDFQGNTTDIDGE